MGCIESSAAGPESEIDERPQSRSVAPPAGVQAQQLQVPVKVPEDAVPGATIQFKIPDGRWVQVTIPESSSPGDTITVSVPRTVKKTSVEGENFANLHDAFKFCDPGHTGFITDHSRFYKVATALASLEGNQEFVWRTLDQDGNGKVNWPEFVEWAEANHVDLPVGLGDEDDGGISFPALWTGPTDDPNWVGQVEITDTPHFMDLDDLMQRTYKNVWTRDRKKTGVDKVPKSYELVKAKRCENFKDWRRYYMKRHQLAHACSSKTGFMQRPALTNQAAGIVRRQHLRNYCNEWLLFHGTSRAAAESILSGAGDFVISLAGSATGTLYGKGTYFAESITKADEYAKQEPDGLCCVLVCRVVGGHVLYNDEVTPNPDLLQQKATSGAYHMVLGDREKCRGTFKEYVIFDADQIYVEYALYYKRVY
mmetsp:Transcript_101396/g.180270  ORF Transcript_101396/g.180270 Transcript_101396/m.180270 type:complete len:423 (+) Transcript_101396:91-1359(+)